LVIDAIRNSSGGAHHLLRSLAINLHKYSPLNIRYIIFTDSAFAASEVDTDICSIFRTPTLFRLPIISQIYQSVLISTFCFFTGGSLVSLDLGSLARARSRIGVVQDALLFRPDLTRLYDVGIRFSIRYQILRLVFKTSIHDYTHLVFFSQSSRSEFINSKFFRPHIASAVIPHGLSDHWELDPENSLEKSFDISDGILRIIYVSPYFPYKNHEFVVNEVLQTAARRPSVTFSVRFVGGNFPVDFVRRLSTYTKKNNVKFECLPFVNLRLVQKYIKESDLFIFASECEAFGVTLLEGMRLKSYMIVSDIPVAREILGDAGLYFSTDKTGELSKLILKYIDNAGSNPAGVINLRHRAYRRSLQFNSDDQISSLIKFLVNRSQ